MKQLLCLFSCAILATSNAETDYFEQIPIRRVYQSPQFTQASDAAIGREILAIITRHPEAAAQLNEDWLACLRAWVSLKNGGTHPVL